MHHEGILIFFVFCITLIITILILWWCNWKGIHSHGYDDLDDTNVNNTTQLILQQPPYPVRGYPLPARYGINNQYHSSMPMPSPQPGYMLNPSAPFTSDDGTPYPPGPVPVSVPYPPAGYPPNTRAPYPPDGDNGWGPPYPPGPALPAPASAPYPADPEPELESPPPPYDVAVQFPNIYIPVVLPK